MGQIITIEDIAQRICFIRGVKVMLDRDLASLYEVETKRLKEQVKRNLDRFPTDFMFELTKEEFHYLRSQFATSSWGGPRYVPMAFTEQGVAMLSSVLRSKRAIQVNVQIMRAFVKLRHILLDHAELKRELDELRNQTEEKFQVVFTVLDKLVNEGDEEKRKIGFIENGVKKC
jgi:phage regulator Rha-like protein